MLKDKFGYEKNNVVVRIKNFIFAHFICRHKEKVILSESVDGIQAGCKKCGRVKFFTK